LPAARKSTTRRAPRRESPILRSKLVPPNLGTGVLARPRLGGALAAHSGFPLSLVVADAGYGKTTLLAGHARALRAPMVWYSLMASDVDLAVFARHLLAGLRERSPRFGRAFERALAEGVRGASGAEHLAGVFLHELATLRGPAIHLVLDDYHEIGAGSAVHAFLSAILRQPPPTLRLLVGSRTLPPLNVERLRVRGEVFELDSSHLRFTHEELVTLFTEVYERRLADDDLASLEATTAGWPTAVHLVHEALVRSPDREIPEVLAELRGPGVDLHEFLAGEVLARLDADEAGLLERIAALGRFDGGLAAALSGGRDRTAVLRRLTRRGLVRSFGAGADETSYELHDLVREFLRRRVLAEQGPAAWSALEADTARVLASRGEDERALKHWLLAGRGDEAVTLAVQLAPRLLREGRAATLKRYLLDLPEALVAGNLELRLALTEARLALSEWDDAEREFTTLLRLAEDRGARALLCRALLGLCKVLNMRGRHEQVLGMAERGLAMAEDLDPELRIRLLQRKAGAHFYLGQLRAAVRILGEVKSLLPASPDPDLELPTLHNFAMAYGAMGHFREAIREFEAALSRVRVAPSPRAPLYLSNIAYILAEVGELTDARAAAEECLTLARRFANRAQEMTGKSVLAQILAQSGDQDGALAALREAEAMNRELRMEVLAGDLLALRGRIFCARGQYRRGAEFLGRSIERLGEKNRPRQVEFRGLLAWCELRAGRPRVARELLEKSLPQAEAGENDYERMRVHYWFAESQLALGETAGVRRSLEVALALVRELGFDYFLAVQARESAAPLLHAIELGIEVDVAAAALAEAGPVVEADLLERLGRAKGAGGEAAVSVLAEIGGRLARTQLAALATKRPALKPAITTALRHIDARVARGTEPAERGTPTVRLVLFGPPRLEIDGRSVPASAWRAQRAFHILIHLALHPSGAQRDQLLEAFWPGRQLAAGKKNFHPTLSYIRSLLPEAAVPVLARDAERYRLEPRYPLTCDAWDFDRRLEEARGTRDDQARRRALLAAAELAAQPFLDGLYGDWADEAQAKMRDRVEQLMIRCGEIEMQAAAWESALVHLKRASELDAFREKTRVAMIECLVRSGARRAARVEWERTVALLRDELDVEPLPETVAEVRQLLGPAAGDDSPTAEEEEWPDSADSDGAEEVAAIGQAALKGNR